ncbi:MAG: endolytic transglycosylase MltG [Coriobacteriales bacterium]|jgi:UPF0755 protein|nr:endolytic transglycosylase MltG [Coriobacteriales bacterium]
MAEYQGRHQRQNKPAPKEAETGVSQPGQARHGAVRHYEFRRSNAAHRKAAREFPTYDTSAIRPRHSRRHTVLVVSLIIALIAALLAGGFFAYSMFSTPTQVVVGTPIKVTVPTGSTTTDIARMLRQTGVLTDESGFINAVKERGVAEQLKPGDYQLEAGMDLSNKINELVDALIAGPLPEDTIARLTIPEGLSVEQTAAKVASTPGLTIKAEDFIALAYQADRYQGDYPFLVGVYNNSLEGYLYPKTYDIPKTANADYVIRVLLDQFTVETEGLDLVYATEHGLSLFQVLTIASLIEKETALDEERALVSSVVYNRLSEGMRLQIDATVIYALGPSYDGHPLYNVDLEVDSPYNTYQVDALPAGPICSPQIKSIEAAAHPQDSSYLYYVLTSKGGQHTFCSTYEEFEQAKAVYEEVFGIA